VASQLRAEGRNRTRSQILATAVEVFAENGYRSTTMSQVADRAGVGRATLYLHYSSKSELADDIARSLQPQMVAVLLKLPRVATTTAGIEQWIDELVVVLRTFGSVTAVVNEAIGHNRQLAKTLVASMHSTAETIIAEFQRQGDIAPWLDEGTLAMLLTSTALLSPIVFGPIGDEDEAQNRRDLAGLWALVLPAGDPSPRRPGEGRDDGKARNNREQSGQKPIR